ncbi:hypothetical protein GSY69_04120 [Brevibacterium sp. 5221]|uniref:YCII-related domain-containing protein n=1 Tax=Brevibacterium rongguiense TaxID=2695267 RepID=A0A6N9H542_9MICO|nr:MULTISPECIES: YciI family protein [Brevibacterium]MYM19178.1 hypothetical protein [Brevibacterium rongguiense]WAL40856.1 YciI family protein [Brevibacterium sp. BRM-1]
MAIFAVTYEYGPDIDTRMAARPAHRTWQAKLFDAGVLLASGPLEDDFVPGGLLIMQADTRHNIEDTLTQDPYAAAEVISSTTIRGWNPVFGPFAPEA